MPRKSTQDKVEGVAIRLFAKNGYQSTSTRKIAEEAGVSELTIYRCYKTKLDLFRQAFLKQSPDRWLKTIEPDPAKTTEEQLLYLCETLYKTLIEREDLIRIFYQDADQCQEILKAGREVPKKILVPIANYLQKVCPILPEATARVLAIQVFTAYLGRFLLTSSMGEEILPYSIKIFHREMVETYALRIKDACK